MMEMSLCLETLSWFGYNILLEQRIYRRIQPTPIGISWNSWFSVEYIHLDEYDSLKTTVSS